MVWKRDLLLVDQNLQSHYLPPSHPACLGSPCLSVSPRLLSVSLWVIFLSFCDYSYLSVFIRLCLCLPFLLSGCVSSVSATSLSLGVYLLLHLSLCMNLSVFLICPFFSPSLSLHLF